MTTRLYCDHCDKEYPKEELYFITGYCKVGAMKRGQKAVLRKDICKECIRNIFGVE